MFDSGYNITYLLRLSMSIHDLFLRYKQFCMHILYNGQHIRGNTYHITDIGSVNNITVTYWEYPYNGFDTLRNKKKCRIFKLDPVMLLIIVDIILVGFCNGTYEGIF